MVEEIALWRFGEKRVLGGGNSVCKGPETANIWVYLRKRKLEKEV